MNRLVLIAALLLFVVASFAFLDEEEAKFLTFLAKYERSYKGEEYRFRKKVYAENMREWALKTEKSPMATFGENKFADLTKEEFIAYVSSGVSEPETTLLNQEKQEKVSAPACTGYSRSIGHYVSTSPTRGTEYTCGDTITVSWSTRRSHNLVLYFCAFTMESYESGISSGCYMTSSPIADSTGSYAYGTSNFCAQDAYKNGTTFYAIFFDESDCVYNYGARVSLQPVGYTKPTWTTSDIVAQDLVMPVKNQGSCGSCYTFGATATYESWIIKNSVTTPNNYSEQDVLDCLSGNVCGGGDDGCQGGSTTKAMGYIMTNGLNLLSAYPYTSGGTGNQNCQCSHSSGSTGPKLTGYHYSIANEDQLCADVQSFGAVSVSLDAAILSGYTSGILTSVDEPSCHTTPTHAVNLVGCSSDGGYTVFKVRNSWGSYWGESGYFRIRADDNLCGILTDAYYAIEGSRASVAGFSLLLVVITLILL